MANKNNEKKSEQKVDIKEALKENAARMEIAKELNHNKNTVEEAIAENQSRMKTAKELNNNISNILGERLAKTRRFPPC